MVFLLNKLILKVYDVFFFFECYKVGVWVFLFFVFILLDNLEFNVNCEVWENL